jgi:hypothetical protein
LFDLPLSLHAELVNLMLFIACLLKVGFCTGLILVPISIIAHELVAHENAKRGRNQ